MKTHIVITRVKSGEENKYEKFLSLARRGWVDGWTANKSFSPDDFILFYFGAPIQSIVAVGVVSSESWGEEGIFDWTEKDREIFCNYDPVWVLDNAIRLDELANKAGVSGWYKSKPYRSHREVPPESASALLNEIVAMNPTLEAELELTGISILKSDKLIDQDMGDEESKRVGQSGAGFGTYGKNAKVESAAISFVRRLYEDKGWSVKSVERENRGFDLICKKQGKEKNVEVKGISGNKPSFIITANEVRQAKNNPNFVLCVVIRAISETPKLLQYSAKQFLREFTLKPIQYKATPNKS